MTNGVYSQAWRNKYAKSEEEQISDIDKMKQEINGSWDNYKKIKKNKDSTDYRYVYRKGKEVQLISIHWEHKNEMCEYVQEFYFHNGQVILIELITTLTESNRIVNKQKMYFEDEQLVSWFDYDDRVDRNTEKFKKAATERNEYLTNLIAESLN